MVQTTQETGTDKRAGTLHTASIITVLILLGISLYLSYTEFVSKSVLCLDTASFDCDLVQSSAYSKVLGIPLAYLGTAANLGLLLLLLLENRIGLLREYGIVLLGGLTLFATIFSIWLIYVQAVVLRSYCQWCLAHEAGIFVLFALTAVRLWRFMTEDDM